MNPDILLSMDNSKLFQDGIACFGLPSKRTCPGSTKECRAYCYSNFHTYCFPNVKSAKWRNYQAAQNLDIFVHKVNEAIECLPRFFKYLRIHDSGDFFSQDYLDSWKYIAEEHPDIRFYAYTKSLHLDWEYLPKNFVMIQSCEGKYDHLMDNTKSIARIFPDIKSLEQAGYVNGTQSDLIAASGLPRIGLIAHGTGRFIWRKLQCPQS